MITCQQHYLRAFANLDTESFVAELRVILQVAEQTLDQYTPLIEHGIDSLIAVEVRSWFVKELKIDMPVLKILGGGSIADLSEQALKQLPEKVLASIEKGAKLEPPAQALPAPLVQPKSEAPLSSSASAYTPPERTSTGDVSNDISSAASSSSVTEPESAKSEEEQPTVAIQSPPKFLKSEPVSFAQSRFWFLRLFLQDPTTFNVTFYYKVTGKLRVDALERAVGAIGSRHEAFRTCFVGDETEQDTAYQKIMETSRLKLDYKKIDNVEDVASEYVKLQNHLYDIENGDLMHLKLFSIDPSTHYLIVSYHHILMDGISVQILLSDLEKAYKGQSLGGPPRELTTFSRTQRENYESGKLDNALRYWRDVFSSDPPVLPLLPISAVSSRVPMTAFNVRQIHRHLDPGLVARVKQASRSQRCTPFHLYLAVFSTMLFKFTEAQDLTIGIADADRGDEAMGTIGLFLNLLPLRFRRKAGQSFAEAITEARNTAYAALGSSVPFDVLLKDLNVPRSSQYSPFFQAFFDYRQGTQTKQSFDNCQFEMLDALPGRTGYVITLDVTDSAGGSTVAIRTQTSLYDQTATDLLLDTYIGLLELVCENTSVPWQSAPLFSSKQMKQAVELGRGESHHPHDC